MAEPVKRIYQYSRQQVMKAFPEALNSFGMKTIGSLDNLGLLSFRRKADRIFYAHVVEHKDKTTHVSIAPGFSFMKDRVQSELPVTRIEQIMNALSEALPTEKS